MAHHTSRWAFPPDPGAVRDARQFVRDVLQARVTPEQLEGMVLVTSELVTNAVIHARSDFDLILETNGVIRLDVLDGSPTPPAVRPPRTDDSGGRGLRIVEQVCDRWGYTAEGTGKRVWCELDGAD